MAPIRHDLDALAYAGICRKIKTVLSEEIGLYVNGYEHSGEIDEPPHVVIEPGRGIALRLSTGVCLPLPSDLERTAYACLTEQDRTILRRLGVPLD